MARIWSWRVVVILVSLVQVGIGLASSRSTVHPESARFVVAFCSAIAGLGLLASATTSFRSAAGAMNLLLLLACLPPLAGGLLDLFEPGPRAPMSARFYAGVAVTALSCL